MIGNEPRDVLSAIYRAWTVPLHPDDPGPTPPVDDEPDPDLAAGVCPRCGTPLELDGCSTANVRLRGAP
jgi:hypothetical protein